MPAVRSATAQHPGGSTLHSHERVQLAKGIVKALFTTPPSQPTEVVVRDDHVDIEPAEQTQSDS
jgi:hypothetical protein